MFAGARAARLKAAAKVTSAELTETPTAALWPATAEFAAGTHVGADSFRHRIRRWSRVAVLGASSSLTLLGCASCQSQAKNTDPPAGTSQAANQSASAELVGVDTSKLTTREKEQWSTFVGQLLAPCSDHPVPLRQCVSEKRACEACVPAAQFLVGQVTAGKSGAQVEGAYRARFAEETAHNIDPGSSPSKGPAEAPVTVVEWADFQCPACAATSPILDQLLEAYPDHVRLVYKHYPLSMHENAEGAARAAVAAQKQGKFWELHHAMFANQESLDDAGLKKMASELGLDVKQWDADRRSEAVADAVNADRKAAEKLGLRGTPSVFINGRSFDSDHFSVLEDLHPWIELEVRLRTGKTITSKPTASSSTATPQVQVPAASH
jgi:protein-disulfide isomerase